MISKGAQHVTCQECGAKGVIYIGVQKANADYKVKDFLEHKQTCSLFQRPQPKHLRAGKASVRRQERRANDLVGAHETLGSGSVGMDGDGRSFHGWRTESKQTKRDYYTLTQQIWSKLVVGAQRAGEEPLLHVEFRHRLPATRHVVVRLDFFRSLEDGLEVKEVFNLAKTSFRLCEAHGAQPVLVPLNPPGVEVHERDFLQLKEQHDRHSKGDLLGS